MAIEDPQYNCYARIEDLPEHRLETTTQFFRDYKQLEPSEVHVQDFQPLEKAQQVIEEAVARYRNQGRS